VAGSFSSIGPVTTQNIGFDAASQKLKSAVVTFENTPGQVKLQDRFLLGDRAILQAQSAPSGREALLGDLKKLSEASGLPFDEKSVHIETATFKEPAALDPSTSHRVTDIEARGRIERDKPPVGDGQDYLIASATVKIKDARAELTDLANSKGNSIRFLEVQAKDGGTYGFYHDQADEPGGLPMLLGPGQPSAPHAAPTAVSPPVQAQQAPDSAHLEQQGNVVPEEAHLELGKVIPPGGHLEGGQAIPAGGHLELGHVIPAGGSLEYGHVVPAGSHLEDGFVVPEGGHLELGHVVPAGGSLESGHVVPEGSHLEDGFVVPEGGHLESGHVVPAGFHLEYGKVVGPDE
jgi:hypothetical protein